MSKADVTKLAYIGSIPNAERSSDEWYTPPRYIDMARKVMNSIDLDPFSCAHANETVKAKKFFSVDDSALTQPWSRIGKVTVWMNPPYGRGTLGPAIDAFLAAWLDGQISHAVILVNNATETGWFQRMARECSAQCQVERRIAFYNDDGKETSGNTRGQIFLYFGSAEARFKKIFDQIGVVLCR